MFMAMNLEPLEPVPVSTPVDYCCLIVISNKRTHSHRKIMDGLEVRVVVLNELNPFRHLFPELDVPVEAGRYKEVCATGGHDRVCHNVSVHVAPLVHRRTRQSFKVRLGVDRLGMVS